jgi:hypothetical protein
MTTATRWPVLVLCGDWDAVDHCGVAHSERALLAGGSLPPTVVDPSTVRSAVRAVWRARQRRAPVLVVYPTRSTVARWRPLVTLLVTAVLRRGDDLRLHLHEYRVFREVRWALNLIILLGRPTVVVSSRGEQALMARSLAGRLGRARIEVIPPFGPLTPATTRTTAADAVGTGIVGVFGFAGPAKGTQLISAVVGALPERYKRLELVGSGWRDVAWPADVAERVEIAPLGFVPSAELGPVFERWELAVAPFSDGASDGRSSLRIPLSHGIPTITEAGRSEDLTLRPSHLGLVGADPAATISATIALAADPEARRRGAAEVDEFERAARQRLRAALLGDGSPEPSTLAPRALT